MEGKKSVLILGIVALLFGVLTAFFGYKYSSEKTAAADYRAEQLAINNEFETLTVDFDALSEEFEAIKSENIELDEELQAKIAELDAQKEKASKLIRSGGSSKLKEAKNLIAQLQTEKEQLLNTIAVLREEKRVLEEEKALLAANLSEEKEKNAVLTKDKIKLTEEKEELIVDLGEMTEERDELIPIANYGQVIQVNAIQAEAVRYKKSGKERKARSKSADKLKVCFQVENNPVAVVGEQDYYIRILSPEGTAIYEEQNGSGTFTSLENGKDIRYTAEAKVNYDNEVKNVCWYWAQTNGYGKGEYVAEVYHRGYKVGTEKFQL